MKAALEKWNHLNEMEKKIWLHNENRRNEKNYFINKNVTKMYSGAHVMYKDFLNRVWLMMGYHCAELWNQN